MIPVTKAYIPDKEKYKAYVEKILNSGWLTNNGSLLQQLEERLAKHLGVKHLICVANGSLALHIAYKVLDLKGEVITSPFSFAATTSTLAWENLTPVFADIDAKNFNLDPSNIASLINENTTGIVPVHVFGNPCKVEYIQSIAKEYNLKVIYDAAHAFGTKYSDKHGNNQSVLSYGDISTISFHSTKLFHTVEGGALITNDDELARKIRLSINFGLSGPTTIESVGTNAKMNEFEAAMGLCVLDEINTINYERKKIWQTYQKELEGLVNFQEWNPKSQNNYAYAPILFENEKQLLNIESKLKINKILPRRYFYPSLDTLNFLKDNFSKTETNSTSLQNSEVFNQNSNSISSRVLCLPIYPGLKRSCQDKIIGIIKSEM